MAWPGSPPENTVTILWRMASPPQSLNQMGKQSCGFLQVQPCINRHANAVSVAYVGPFRVFVVRVCHINSSHICPCFLSEHECKWAQADWACAMGKVDLDIPGEGECRSSCCISETCASFQWIPGEHLSHFHNRVITNLNNNHGNISYYTRRP